MKEAMFYQQLEKNRVQCNLCPHNCKLKNDQTGICCVRQNINGKLFSLVYGRAIAVHVDPIEKKPLFHVAPGSRSFSMSTVGCNFKCEFCQNSNISQIPKSVDPAASGTEISPAEIVAAAVKSQCRSIAYTYTEPTIYFEYAYDCCKIAHQENILNVFVSNGYINPEPLKHISPYLDAANIDLKSFQEKFYKELVGAKLTPVLNSLKLMKKLDIWLEITTLLIPSKNDSYEELRDIARFIKQELGEETPWHISRFYPQHKLTTIPPTPVATLVKAREIGLSEGLRYVYTGNVPGDMGESTYCCNCGKEILKRYGFRLMGTNIVDSKCEFCDAQIDGLKIG